MTLFPFHMLYFASVDGHWSKTRFTDNHDHARTWTIVHHPCLTCVRVDFPQGLYAIWVVPCLPQTAMELLAGFIYPFWPAVGAAFIARGIATCGMMHIGRSLARPFAFRLRS